MGNAPNWTNEEKELLCEMWGQKSMRTMVKRLNRSDSGIINQARRLGLGAFTDNGDYVTLNQLMQVINGTKTYSYQKKSWIENRGLPVKTKMLQELRVKVIYIEDFWKWADKDREFLDFSRFEKYALGAEPDWVDQKRRQDIMKGRRVKKTPWTKSEDARLIHLLEKHKYSQKEISDMMGRSCGAIQRRCSDLGLMARPVRADNHVKWTKEEYEVLRQMILDGSSYMVIQERIGKSEKAIRGTVYRMYGTENIDKARAIIQKGERHGAEKNTGSCEDLRGDRLDH